MKEIELSFITVMSLSVNSSSASDDADEAQVDAIENMSDEDIEKMTPEQFAAEHSPEEEGGSGDDENDDEQNEEVNDDTLGDDEPDDEPADDANEDEQPDAAAEGGSEQAEDADESTDTQPSEEELAANATAYEAAYKQLFGAPIKAGGRMTQLRGVDHAQNLIEMGIDYNKKMQQMKPHMKALRTLEKQGLLSDENKLNLLLEAQAGKPEAIRKLIAQAEIDVIDIADDGGLEYTPENQMVSDEEVGIEDALQTIRGSDAYQKTIDVMTNNFDAASKGIISQNPHYITALNQDIESGIYDNVMDMVQYQKDMKMIPAGTSDIEAYINTVQQMAANEQQQATPAQQANTANTANPEQQPTRRSNKRKVGMSSSRSSTKKKEPNYDPLLMSDEDFMKVEGANTL